MDTAPNKKIDNTNLTKAPAQAAAPLKLERPAKNSPIIDPDSSATSNFLANKILSTTYTKNQLLRRLLLIKDFINYKLFQATDKHTFGEAVSGFSLSHPYALPELSWLQSLGEEFFREFKPETITPLLKELDHLFGHLSIGILYIPFELPEDQALDKGASLQEDSALAQIGRWLKDNVGRNFVFEVKFDPNLIAGAALSINGVYKDFSLRANLEKNKQQVAQSLSAFKQT